MSSTEVWASVALILTQYDLLKHPFYQAWSNGELTHADLKFYGEQYVSHVAAFPTYLTALHARLPEGETRKAVLANALEEEGNGRSHADIWRQFTAGMAAQTVQGAAYGEGKTLHELARLVRTFRDIGEKAPAAEALAAFYAYESQVPRIAETKMDGLTGHYGADDESCEYFAIHKIADIHHAQVWHDLIEIELANDPAAKADVLRGTERAAAALWGALDGIEAMRMAQVH